MAGIQVSLVKILRERTGAGVMDCKIALTKANGDVEIAIQSMRRSGVINAARKAANPVSNGLVITKIEGNSGFILEINCQSDFAAKENSFQLFAKKVLETAVNRKITEIDTLKAQYEEERIWMVSKIGENINIRRIAMLEGESLGSYQHGFRIGVLVSTTKADQELTKKLAMHIAASNPEFLKPEDISFELLKKEYQIQLDLAIREGKSQEKAKKIVESRIKKFSEEMSLTSQPFVINPKQSVAQFLKEKNADVIGFLRFELGESIKSNRENYLFRR